MRASNTWRGKALFTGAIVATVALVGTKVLADDAFDIESFYPVSSFVQYDNFSGDYPIVTAVGSQPGTFGGHLYTSWSVFAEDSTGSLDIFTTASTLQALTGNPGATINVGDKISTSGAWGPFHQIPEVSLASTPASNHTFATISTGNALPTAPVFNVSQLNATGSAPSNSLNIAGYYLEIDNVTISSPSNGLTALPSYTTVITQETFTVTDNTGSMTMFDWTTSYSAATQLAGTPIGAGNVYNVKGFVSYNTGGPLEFTALSMTAVPEPSTVMLVGTGILGLLALRRRK